MAVDGVQLPRVNGNWAGVPVVVQGLGHDPAT